MKKTLEVLPEGILKGEIIDLRRRGSNCCTVEIYNYLQDKLATIPMICRDTKYDKRAINQAIQNLEKAESIWYVEEKTCPVTGTMEWYLTTNQKRAGRNFIQHKLWEGEVS